MTASAGRAGSPTRRPIASYARLLLTGVSLAISTAAGAQVGATASIYSDYRFRGVSLSEGRPVGIVDVSYDLASGLYVAASGQAVATKDEGPQLLGYGLSGGYAFTLRPGLAADLGVVHSRYSHYSGLSGRTAYTEVYAGVTGRIIGARIAVSPYYLGSAHWTAYGEINGHFDLSRATLIDGGIGLLAPVGDSYGSQGHPQVDARLGIAQRLGPVTLHASATVRGRDYLNSGRSHGRIAFVAGLSTTL